MYKKNLNWQSFVKLFNYKAFKKFILRNLNKWLFYIADKQLITQKSASYHPGFTKNIAFNLDR